MHRDRPFFLLRCVLLRALCELVSRGGFGARGFRATTWRPWCFLRQSVVFSQVFSEDAAFPGDASAVMSRLQAMLKDLPPPPDQEANFDRFEGTGERGDSRKSERQWHKAATGEGCCGFDSQTRRPRHVHRHASAKLFFFVSEGMAL